MKFIVIDNPKVWGFILRKIYGIKKIDFTQN
ncbi:MAG: stage V sporulation protein SpoVM [Acutalibacteraceae bacterium]|nr:stage V sporulation protein SpoVM [Acutalibacteraceae bacterium]